MYENKATPNQREVKKNELNRQTQRRIMSTSE